MPTEFRFCVRPMSDTERELFGKLLPAIRRIGARAEALACGYKTADMESLGGEGAAKAALLEQIRDLAVQSGAVKIQTEKG